MMSNIPPTWIQSEQIMVLMTTDQPLAMSFIQKFTNFFNFIFQKYFFGRAYFEIVEKGFLCLIQDLNTFKTLWTPIPEIVKQEVRDHPIAKNDFITEKITQENYPPNGFVYDFEFLNKNSSIFAPYIQNFFHDLHPDIIVKWDQPHVVILLPKWEYFKIYVDALHILYHDVS